MKRRTILMVCTAAFIGVCFTALCFAQEMPAPGTVIDKNNYKKYAHLFPPEVAQGFEDGWGLHDPFSIQVGETKSYPFPKAFVALSAKNKGKYSLDKDTNIVGGWDRNGLPFPDLKKDDKDFVTKLMWNYDGRYDNDDRDERRMNAITRRKGERVKSTETRVAWLMLTNRMILDPKPLYPTPTNLKTTHFLHFTAPESMKNTILMDYRYLDLNKADETFVYLPTLRRVLRGEAGQRSTPIQSVCFSLDDMNVFDGRTSEFTYKLVGEQKVLACRNSNNAEVIKKAWPPTKVPSFASKTWDVVDTYVIDIFSRNPKYPQSKKRVWMDKENLHIYYGVIWDRAGAFWKLYEISFTPLPIPGDSPMILMSGHYALDVQFGFIAHTTGLETVGNVGLKYDEFTHAALLKMGR
jgi:hypothetical protein